MGRKKWSRHTFEVAIGIVVIKETTWLQANVHVETRKQADQQVGVANCLKAQDNLMMS